MKPRSGLISVVVCLIILVACFTQIGATAYIGNVNPTLDRSSRYESSYVVERFNSTHYQATNGTSGAVQFEPNANPTQLINNVMGNSTFGNVVVLKDATYSITASLIPVSGITVMGSGIGTVLSPAAGITCFSLSSKNNVTITNLSIDGAGTSEVGIKLVASSRCIIKGNWIHGTANSAVFLMTNSTYNHIIQNQIWSTGTTADGTIYLYNGNDYNEVSNNWLYGNAKPGIRVGLSKRCDIKNNEILKGSQDGILIRNSTDCTISGNQIFYNTQYGIRSEGCSRNQYTDNYCERNGFHGMDVSQSHNCQFIGNHLDYNGLYGMHLDNEGSPLFTSDFHLVEANYIFNNTGTGLRVTGTNNTRITGNFIRRNGYGTGDKSGLVLVNKACNNTITENTITGNNIYDISIATSNCADNVIRSANVFNVLSDVGTRTILKDNIGNVSPSDGSAFSYTVSKVGSNYFAVNGSSGLVEFGPSTNATYVFQQSLGNMTNGGWLMAKGGRYTDIHIRLPNTQKTYKITGEGSTDTVFVGASGRSVFNATGSGGGWGTKSGRLILEDLTCEAVDYQTIGVQWWSINFLRVKLNGTVGDSHYMLKGGGSGAPASPSSMTDCIFETNGGLLYSYMLYLWYEGLTINNPTFLLVGNDIRGLCYILGTYCKIVKPVIHSWSGRDITVAAFSVVGSNTVLVVDDIYYNHSGVTAPTYYFFGWNAGGASGSTIYCQNIQVGWEDRPDRISNDSDTSAILKCSGWYNEKGFSSSVVLNNVANNTWVSHNLADFNGYSSINLQLGCNGNYNATVTTIDKTVHAMVLGTNSTKFLIAGNNATYSGYAWCIYNP